MVIILSSESSHAKIKIVLAQILIFQLTEYGGFPIISIFSSEGNADVPYQVGLPLNELNSLVQIANANDFVFVCGKKSFI